MPAEHTVADEPKALRLARYLREFVRLRRTTVRNVEMYEEVLWFGDVPQEKECRSPAWSDEFEAGDSWLSVEKQQFPKPPLPPDTILPWVDQGALTRAAEEMPPLNPTILVPDSEAEVGDGEEPPLREESLKQHPEVTEAYERYRPTWLAWAEEHFRRERIQKVYARLFNLHTQLRKQGELVELVLGLGLLDWHRSDHPWVRRHVVAARADLLFDPKTGMIRVEAPPDGARPHIEDEMLEPGVRPDRHLYDAMGEQLSEIGDDLWDHPRIFEALRFWGHAVHSDSQWSQTLSPSPTNDDKPLLTFAPALILRRRNEAGMARIYDRMIGQLGGEGGEPPPGWTALVEYLSDSDDSGPRAAGAEFNQNLSLDTNETFFPLPSNREQRRIVEALRHRRGVLVQGPPGTGKSHTIANLVCHLLATGQRVLITAETGRALQVIKEKLPNELQALCVSLIGQGADAFAELDAAVQGITVRQAAYRPGIYEGEIAEVDRDLGDARREVAVLTSELRSLREGETVVHSICNAAYTGTASGIAKHVATESQKFGWLQLPMEASDAPPVPGRDLLRWLRIRRQHSEEQITGAQLRIVESGTLPPPESFASAVAAAREAEQAAQALVGLRNHPAYRWISTLEPRQRAILKRALEGLAERRNALLRHGPSWTGDAVAESLSGRRARWQTLLNRSQELLQKIDQLLDSLGSSNVRLPTGRDLGRLRDDAQAALCYVESRGKWKKFGFLTPKELKDRLYLRDEVTVDGHPAETIDRLRLVLAYLDLTSALAALDASWADFGGLPAGSDRRIRLAAVKEQVAALGDILSFADDCLAAEYHLSAAAPGIPLPDWAKGEEGKWLEIIEAAVIEERRRGAMEQVTSCLSALVAVRDLHDAHPVIASLVAAMSERNIRAYSEAYDDLHRIEKVRRDQALRGETEAALGAAVPGLIDAVARTIADTAWDQRFADWEPAWRWAVADNWLRKRADFGYQQRLWDRLNECNERIGKLIARSAAARAWKHFFARLTVRESQALRAWRQAVRAIGKGTGKSGRTEWLRREARASMDQCRKAIPVWIMPRYLVAEMLEPAPERYDTIIVDEASQLGIESLFLFYVGKKILVVGDDQQISPYAIGVPEAAIEDLRRRYLDGIPNQVALEAQRSLYDNAQIRFGENIVLREHFRCMPEIIQFSNDLCYAPYGTPLDPLRAYPPARLPPLVVRRVPDGYRTGSRQNALNEPEAEAIVAQIKACVEDPHYTGRTFGVISLQGEAQAKLIERELLDALDPEIIEERRLICGDAYAFQGDERHVMFLSMVAAPGEWHIGVLADDAARRRFNVAASRAKDQLWLFHSASLDDLSTRCMRHKLLSYMLNPTRGPTQADKQEFESEFERAVYELISAKGFHVRSQVRIGDRANPYRIDLVVEGMRGRLAVECDGEYWHGPERYEHDMARQRDLERAGWQFVRIRGGDFYRDSEQAIEPLWKELGRLGIQPGGVDDAEAEPPPPWDGAMNRSAGEVFQEGRGGPNAPEPKQNPENPPSAASAGNGAGQSGSPAGRADHCPPEPPESGQPPPHEHPPNAEPRVLFPRGFKPSPYTNYTGPHGPDPRTANPAAIADVLGRIVEVEGPVVTKRAYDVYLGAVGIRRLGRALKSALHKGLSQAIQQRAVVAEPEVKDGGYLYSVLRVPGTAAIRVRQRGPRTLQEIPPSELQTVGRHLAAERGFIPGSDEHLHAILEFYGLKRLTTQARTRIREILDLPLKHVDEFLSSLGS